MWYSNGNNTKPYDDSLERVGIGKTSLSKLKVGNSFYSSNGEILGFIVPKSEREILIEKLQTEEGEIKEDENFIYIRAKEDEKSIYYIITYYILKLVNNSRNYRKNI